MIGCKYSKGERKNKVFFPPSLAYPAPHDTVKLSHNDRFDLVVIMLKMSNPEISVDKIEQEIFNNIDTKNNNSSSQEIDTNGILEQQRNYIKSFIETAKSRTEVRNKWPQSLNRFPFIVLRPSAFIFLVVLKLLFKDQR